MFKLCLVIPFTSILVIQTALADVCFSFCMEIASLAVMGSDYKYLL